MIKRLGVIHSSDLALTSPPENGTLPLLCVELRQDCETSFPGVFSDHAGEDAVFGFD